MKAFTLLFFLGLYELSAYAQNSGNDLLRMCGGVVQAMDGGEVTLSTHFDSGYCVGLMKGIINTSRIYKVGYNIERELCLPIDGIDNDQAMRIVVKYLKAKPELLHLDHSALAFNALAKAYPCANDGANR